MNGTHDKVTKRINMVFRIIFSFAVLWIVAVFALIFVFAHAVSKADFSGGIKPIVAEIWCGKRDCLDGGKE